MFPKVVKPLAIPFAALPTTLATPDAADFALFKPLFKRSSDYFLAEDVVEVVLPEDYVEDDEEAPSVLLELDPEA